MKMKVLDHLSLLRWKVSGKVTQCTDILLFNICLYKANMI